MLFLIAYDISNPRRLKKVAKLMEAYGKRVQRSIFECDLRPGKVAILAYQLKALIKPRRDRVHIYQLCSQCPMLGIDTTELNSPDASQPFVF